MEYPLDYEKIFKYFSYEKLPLLDKDSEVGFTKNSLVDPFKIFINSHKELANKFVIGGEGESLHGTRPIFGLTFHHDLTLNLQPSKEIHLEKFLALEVKLLREGNYNSSISSAIGQALIYKESGYKNVIIFLADKGGRIQENNSANLKNFLSSLNLDLIVRKISNDTLLPSV